jgi:tyrosinase
MSYGSTPQQQQKYVRTNVWAKGGTFDDPTILWYARGVAAMKARALAEPTSWRFYAGIHGFNAPLWRLDGYLSDSDQLPSQPQQALFWRQCQHGSWYFLPWHRGYLLALEAVIRAAVISAGGPSDWALPYWNYFGGGDQNQLPPAFASPDWPDGTGNNPLFVEQRWGPNDDGNVFVPLDQVNLDALTVPDFDGVPPPGDPGFGGVDTGFSHGGQTHGDIESQPHDMVHVFVGGGNPQNPNLPGLMTSPSSAGLDPIFYLHHSNIDRLWESWLQESASEGNPTDASWLNGPAASGQREFVMPWPDGTNYVYTPADVGNLAQLDYKYDDLTPAADQQESVAVPKRRRAFAVREFREGVAVARNKDVELVGANEQPVRIAGREESHASVRLQEGPRRKMQDSIDRSNLEAPGAGEPDRVFLSLENVRGLSDAAAFEVFVNGRSAGSVALFGVTEATSTEEGHGGAGLNFVLEISHIVDELHLQNELDVNALDVRIVPSRHVPEEANVTIGRMSIGRQGR